MALQDQITTVARKYGVSPRIFAALVQQESGGRQGVRSGAGAIGLTQLMPGTAATLGVNPNDPTQNLEGGAKYLRQQLDAFGGDYHKALAAYNAGPGAVQKYGGVPPFAETQNYVKSILANAGSVPKATAASTGGSSQTTRTIPGVDNSGLRKALIYNWLQQRGNPNALVSLAAGLDNAQDVPGQTVTTPGSGPSTQASAARGGLDYPLGRHGKVIGVPYQGTHLDFGNWESDNAIDISVPKGTPVVAAADGVVGPQIGPLDSSNPQLAGQRLHLVGKGNEWYYAHLSKLAVRAGQRVQKGQVIGYSGEANGVQHLHIASKKGNPLHEFG